jgi:hypothetical protein
MSKYNIIARKIHAIADSLDPQEPIPVQVQEGDDEGGGELQKILRKYYSNLNKVKNRPELGKLKFLMDNYRVRKNDVILAKIIDDAPGKPIDIREFFTTLRWLMKTRPHMPAVRFLKKLFDYSLEYGMMKLIAILKNRRIRMVFGRSSKEKE